MTLATPPRTGGLGQGGDPARGLIGPDSEGWQHWITEKGSAVKRWNWLLRVAMGLMLVTLTACSLPRIRAEDRLFLPIAVDFLDHYSLAQQPFDDTTLGGLSALAYDRQRDRFYALSDDRGQYGPSRFYQLAISWRLQQNGQPGFNTVTLESATVLRNQEGNPFSPAIWILKDWPWLLIIACGLAVKGMTDKMPRP